MCVRCFQLDVDGVVSAIWRGLQRGERELGIKNRQILCCICGHDEWNEGIVKLALRHRNEGVVGIDAAGSVEGADESYGSTLVAAYEEARKNNLHRTIHAGEASGYKSVIRGIEEMHTGEYSKRHAFALRVRFKTRHQLQLLERIGHGYKLLDDETAYKKYAIEKRIHFEVSKHLKCAPNTRKFILGVSAFGQHDGRRAV